MNFVSILQKNPSFVKNTLFFKSLPVSYCCTLCSFMFYVTLCAHEQFMAPQPLCQPIHVTPKEKSHQRPCLVFSLHFSYPVCLLSVFDMFYILYYNYSYCTRSMALFLWLYSFPVHDGVCEYVWQASYFFTQ